MRSIWTGTQDAIPLCRVQRDVLDSLLRTVDTTPGLTLAALREAVPDATADDVHIAIVKQHLYVDLRTYRVRQHERTPVLSMPSPRSRTRTDWM